MKTRLFIGNLASTVTEVELRDKFSALLSSHKGEADVGNVEVRCKNENNYFGFVDIHLNSSNPSEKSAGVGGANNGIPLFLRKNIDLMNNTKWKGSLIKVQFAKESFIEKLRREQQENQAAKPVASFQQNGRTTLDNTKNLSEQSRNQKHANDILIQLNRSKERRNRSNKFQNNSPQKNNSNCGFEVVSNDIPAPEKFRKSPVKSESPKQKKKPARKSASSSSSDDDSDDNVRDGIPKFKGLLLSYPDGIPEAKPIEVSKKETETVIPVVTVVEEETPIQQKLLSLALEKDHIAREQSSNKSTIKFKKNKQQQSDLLRLQSLEKMKDLQAQRKNLISSALSSVAASAPLTEQRKLLEDEDDSSDEGEAGAPTNKKSKMTLFDDDDEEEEKDQEDLGNDDGDVFQVKKQFEGASGQKLLELKTRWGNDDRFKIDDRFKESDGEEDVEPMEQEKEKQMDILTGILGKVVSSKTKAAGTQKKGGATNDNFSSVIMPRYDPEAEEENEKETVEKEKEEDQQKSSKKKQKEKKSATAETTEKTLSTEPATFKTVSNLKTLFSSAGENDSAKETTPLFSAPSAIPSNSFSLLAAFGKVDDGDEKNTTKQAPLQKKSGHVEAPRNFWQSNPFKYDSSDDEGENEKVKVTIKSKPETSSTSLVVHGKAPFFFTAKDARFEGLEDYFLRYEENTNENGEVGADGTEKKEPVEDFSVKRQELKSIVKAKIRNSRRKDEKRTLAIKRAIRKRKRKLQHRSKSFG